MIGIGKRERAGEGARSDRIGWVEQDRSTDLFHAIVVPNLADGLALALWLAGNRADAEDIVQEACMRALKAILGYRGGSAKAWFLAIVRNAAFTWMAKQRSKSLVMVGDLADIDDLLYEGTAEGAQTQPTAEAELIRRADEKAVAAAIGALALPFREIVVLRDINGLRYTEIADLLNLPVGTVMSRLARGRQHLAVLLGRTTQ